MRYEYFISLNLSYIAATSDERNPKKNNIRRHNSTQRVAVLEATLTTRRGNPINVILQS